MRTTDTGQHQHIRVILHDVLQLTLELADTRRQLHSLGPDLFQLLQHPVPRRLHFSTL